MQCRPLTVQPRLVKFVKVNLVFVLLAVLTNVAMEIAIPTLEKAGVVVEHGWGQSLAVDVGGLILFCALFNLIGGVIYNSTNLRSVEMGVFSLGVGLILEFAFMRPDWALQILALRPTLRDLLAVVVSMLYWYISWGLPSFLIGRYLLSLEV
jgi:hypothetical protein